MATARYYHPKGNIRQAKGRNASVSVSARRSDATRARRAHVGHRSDREPFAPPEDWYEPAGRNGFRTIVQPPGDGYRHVVTPQQVRDRLAQIPQHFLKYLDVVQLSRMTRKKQNSPCYGMQWGTTLYLYPLEDTLVEHFVQPPHPNLVNEAKMYGGQWRESSPGVWILVWSEQAAQDFYLNNILIHELGHLIDDRNSNYTDRERFAEWFAVEYGYRRSGGRALRGRDKIRRRHHSY